MSAGGNDASESGPPAREKEEEQERECWFRERELLSLFSKKKKNCASPILIFFFSLNDIFFFFNLVASPTRTSFSSSKIQTCNSLVGGTKKVKAHKNPHNILHTFCFVLFIVFFQILCKIYGEEICKSIDYQEKGQNKINKKFTRPLNTMKENIIKWKTKDKM
jgi:hypothetical protein